jgi:hypothetical protein
MLLSKGGEKLIVFEGNVDIVNIQLRNFPIK